MQAIVGCLVALRCFGAAFRRYVRYSKTDRLEDPCCGSPGRVVPLSQTFPRPAGGTGAPLALRAARLFWTGKEGWQGVRRKDRTRNRS